MSSAAEQCTSPRSIEYVLRCYGNSHLPHGSRLIPCPLSSILYPLFRLCLSVIAQQILTIQNALLKQLKLFEFEGTTIPIKRTCAVFITMNPGYAGRSELPDNLKVCIALCAVFVS